MIFQKMYPNNYKFFFKVCKNLSTTFSKIILKLFSNIEYKNIILKFGLLGVYIVY